MIEGFMNPPVDYTISDKDIIEEYKLCGDVKKVAKIYDISVQDVKDVIKQNKIIL